LAFLYLFAAAEQSFALHLRTWHSFFLYTAKRYNNRAHILLVCTLSPTAEQTPLSPSRRRTRLFTSRRDFLLFPDNWQVTFEWHIYIFFQSKNNIKWSLWFSWCHKHMIIVTIAKIREKRSK
jgi:hypothetical protein